MKDLLAPFFCVYNFLMNLFGSYFIVITFIILGGVVHCINKLQDELSEFTLPTCDLTTPIISKKRRRISFISHESAIATFFHNPEQGSRDAANLVDVDIEWNRYLMKSESKIVQDIHDAVNSVSIIFYLYRSHRTKNESNRESMELLLLFQVIMYLKQ